MLFSVLVPQPSTTKTAMRRWCGVIQFPGLKPVMFGTCFVRHGAPDHEVEAKLRADIAECLPDGWKLVSMEPGAVFFQPEGQDDA